MKANILQHLYKHGIAYLIFLAINALFFYPIVFQGKTLSQLDNVKSKSMQTEIHKYEAETGQRPLWTNSMFGGMPTYQILMPQDNTPHTYFKKALFLNKGVLATPIVLAAGMLGAYFLLILLGVDWRVSILGAIGYSFSTYFMDIAEAGHSSKMAAIALTPFILGGAYLVLKEKLLIGISTLGLALAVQIYVNHYQITYYTMFLVGLMCLFFGINYLKNKQTKQLLITAAAIVAGIVLGVLANTHKVYSSYEYMAETIRGKSDVTSNSSKSNGGLDEDYIFGWSYGLSESFSLILPHAKGGGASQSYKNTETYSKVAPFIKSNLTKQGVPFKKQHGIIEKQVGGLFYFGDQPFVGVSIYAGVGLVFLALFGFILAEKTIKSWLISSLVVSLIIAWGNNIFLGSLLVEYMPFYNKFRAVSMALGITQLILAISAAIGLSTWLKADAATKEKSLKLAAMVFSGLLVLGFIILKMDDFIGRNDANLGPELADILLADRKSMLNKDLFVGLLITGIIAGAMFTFTKEWFNDKILLTIISLVVVGDLFIANKGIITKHKFSEATDVFKTPEPSQADKDILKDTDIHYRVLDLTVGNPFTSSDAANFHKSIGGYHAAKLYKFQNVSERYFNNPTAHLNILSMMNTKYIIQQNQQTGQKVAIQNPNNYGDAWFVSKFNQVNDANEAIAAIKDIDKNTAIVTKAAPQTIQTDSTATITLTSYSPDYMVYETNANSAQYAVFSEMYYPPSKGWNTYIDGELLEAGFDNVNYMLRGLNIPAGKHRIEMKFEPSAWYTGIKIGYLSSTILLFLLLLAITRYFKALKTA